MITAETIVCPNCQIPLPAWSVDWHGLEARCPRCEVRLILRDELMPTAPLEEILNRALRLNELPAPAGLRLSTDVQPSRTVLTVHGRLGLAIAQLSLDQEGLEVRRFLTRRHVASKDLTAFLEIQTVWTDIVSEGSPQHTEWHLAVLSPLGEGTPILPVRRWEPARYLAAALNEALLRFRPRAPYRDDQRRPGPGAR